MTDNKPTGPAAAAKEIMEELPIDSLTERLSETGPQSLRDIFWDRHKSVETEQAIEAIILKYCPQDKAVKLVEALTHAISAIESLPDNIFGMNDNGCAWPEREEWPIKDELLSELITALTDYEEATKQ